MTKAKLTSSLIVIVLAMILIGGATMAWFTASDSVSNEFQAGTVLISAEETEVSWSENPEDVRENWNPGDCEWKKFRIENTGTKCVNVRTLLTQTWMEEDADGNWIAWDPVDDQGDPIDAIKVQPCDEQWEIGDDGYLYYMGKLFGTYGREAGESIEFCLKVCLDGSLADNQYQGKRFVLSAVFEAVQGSNMAPVEMGWEYFTACDTKEYYIGYENDNPDFDYNDFGMTFRLSETYKKHSDDTYYLKAISMDFNSIVKGAAHNHLINMFRPLVGDYNYYVDRSDSISEEVTAGGHAGSGNLDIVIYNTTRYLFSTNRLGNDPVSVLVVIDENNFSNPLVPPNPAIWARSFTNEADSPFTDIPFWFTNYDPWMHVLNQPNIDDIKINSKTTTDQYQPSGDDPVYNYANDATELPLIIVIPKPNFIPPKERSTIALAYEEFENYYRFGMPSDWYDMGKDNNHLVNW